MCTAISFLKKDHYFGRNMDYEHSFGEGVLITPRKYLFPFKNDKHYAIIGAGIISENYPLYFDGVNEFGLGMAGLNFPENACYMPYKDGKDNVSSYEFIAWVLRQCKTVSEARKLMRNINLEDRAFSEKYLPAPLHWIISDKNESVTVEPVADGVKIYDNPVGVLTNNPTFDIQMFNLNNYMNISKFTPENKFSDKINLKSYSRGMGGLGLPGDLSSASRFARAAFVKLNSVCGKTESEAVSQFFHILYSVYQQRGCVDLGGEYEITRYSACCNTDKGIYYYTTYENSMVNAVSLYNENLEAEELVFYPFADKMQINMQN